MYAYIKTIFLMTLVALQQSDFSRTDERSSWYLDAFSYFQQTHKMAYIFFTMTLLFIAKTISKFTTIL